MTVLKLQLTLIDNEHLLFVWNAAVVRVGEVATDERPAVS